MRQVDMHTSARLIFGQSQCNQNENAQIFSHYIRYGFRSDCVPDWFSYLYQLCSCYAQTAAVSLNHIHWADHPCLLFIKINSVRVAANRNDSGQLNWQTLKQSSLYSLPFPFVLRPVLFEQSAITVTPMLLNTSDFHALSAWRSLSAYLLLHKIVHFEWNIWECWTGKSFVFMIGWAYVALKTN